MRSMQWRFGKAAVAGLILLLPGTQSTAGDLSIKLFYVPENFSHAMIQRFKARPEIELFDLSLQQRIEYRLATDLPADPQAAAVEAVRRIDANLPWLKQQLQKTIRARMLLSDLRIVRLPAAVLDDRHIIYEASAIKRLIEP